MASGTDDVLETQMRPRAAESLLRNHVELNEREAVMPIGGVISGLLVRLVYTLVRVR